MWCMRAQHSNHAKTFISRRKILQRLRLLFCFFIAVDQNWIMQRMFCIQRRIHQETILSWRRVRIRLCQVVTILAYKQCSVCCTKIYARKTLNSFRRFSINADLCRYAALVREIVRYEIIRYKIKIAIYVFVRSRVNFGNKSFCIGSRNNF